MNCQRRVIRGLRRGLWRQPAGDLPGFFGPVDLAPSGRSVLFHEHP